MKITPKNTPGLKIFEDDEAIRYCFPVAPTQLVYKDNAEPSARPLGEVMEIAEEIFEGKFGMLLQADPQHALASASGRTESPRAKGPLATLEVWSVEPDSFDLVLKLPKDTPAVTAQALLERFLDRAVETTRVVDNLDLLRYESGPALTLPQARQTLIGLERRSGARLDTESLLVALKGLPN